MPHSPAEARFLSTYEPGRYPGVALRVDLAVVTVLEGVLQVVTYTRSRHPFQSFEALPGEFVRPHESLDQAAQRVLDTRLGLSSAVLEQLYTFGAPARDPRMRVISSAWVGLVPPAALEDLAPGVHLRPLVVAWPGETGGPAQVLAPDGKPSLLAFDHADMLGLLVQRLRGKLRYAPIATSLLPETFTLRALRGVHEAVLGRSLNKDSFRRSVLARGELTPTGALQQGVGHRPAALYRRQDREEAPWPR